MPTLLYYALTTEPFPLQASAQSGNLTTAQLTIVATNATAAAVSLQGIIVQLPVGSDAAHLTPTEDAAAIGQVPPANWKLEATQHPPGFVQYLFYPVAGQQTVAAGQSLTFIFNNVAVNRTPGTCELIVTEGSNDCQPPACPTANLYLTKFPNGWGQVSFWADPNIIACDASTTLYWSGPAGATYTIDYYTSATGPVHVPAAGQPALSNEGQYPSPSDPPLQLAQNTTFYLSVVERINNQTYSAQQQATVTVELPQPTITSFTGQLEQQAEQTVLVLNWQTAHADYCHITGDPHLLSPNSTDSRYRRHITSTNPLLSSYTLTATNTAGQV